MHRKLIINEIGPENRVALLEDGNIVELFIERGDESDIAGNIYKGRVQRVLPGIQAAFIDLGLQQAAFIYVGDLIDNRVNDLEAVDNGINDLDQATTLDDVHNDQSETRDVNIEEVICEGQELLVQVSKSPIGTKGARVTSHITLPGRFLVLMPTSDHIGISRRIEDVDERTRLKDIVSDLRDNNLGYIVRTAAEGIEADKLKSEMSFLMNLWRNIQNRYKSAPTPSLLHKELNLSLRAVRDILTHEAESLIIDSKERYSEILSFLDIYMPSLKDNVELYDGNELIFDAFNLEGDISRALNKKVWLKSGGYIVIEHTEALVAIDVNTGRYVGKHNLEETILKTNLEAVKEIAYQVRLRDIGGIVIIDFIDMAKKSNQEKVFNELKEAFNRDRSKTHILPISDLGLIQMTRKRNKKPLFRILTEPCLYCEGEGYLISKQTICYQIFREILRDAVDMTETKLIIKVNPDIAELLRDEENHLIVELEKIIGKQIVVQAATRFHIEQFEIIETYNP
jgi:ribonuclease G